MAVERIEQIQELASRAELRLQRELLDIIKRVRDGAVLAAIEVALERNDFAALVRAIPLDLLTSEFQAATAEVMRDLLESAAGVAPLPFGLEASLNVTNQAVFDFIRNGSLNAALKIRAESEAAIRAAIANSFLFGGHPLAVARGIRDMVGLTANQVLTLANYRARLEKLATGETLRDLAKGALADLKKGGGVTIARRQGLTTERIDAIVAKYRARLLRQRAETIARTLTIDAANEGQARLWRQAVGDGLLDADAWLVAWIVTPDDLLCPLCLKMEGETRQIDGVYPNGVAHPALHPNCRCSEGLVRVAAGRREAA